MRTLITIASIVVMLLGGSLISYRFIEASTDSMGVQLQTIEQSLSAGKWELAKNELAAAQHNWDEDNHWLAVLIDHEIIETISLSMQQLEKYIDTQELTDSIAEVSSLKLQFERLYQSEKITVTNIF